MRTILIVDDELHILSALRRLLLPAGYDIRTAETGSEGLFLLEQQPADMVISDVRMKYMDGLQFLELVKHRYPKILRIALSSYVDETAVLSALQQDIARLYLLKPWDNHHLLEVIGQIFESLDQLRHHQLEQIATMPAELPLTDRTRRRVSELLTSGGGLHNLTSETGQDPVLAAHILKIVNSAYFGTKLGSVEQAVSFLGFRNTRQILQDVLASRSDDGRADAASAVRSGEQLEALAAHARLTDKILCVIYREGFGKDLTSLERSAGLLHDIGIAYLMSHHREQYPQLLMQAAGKDEALLEAEHLAFGLTHQEAGGMLLRWWDLPPPIVETALYHHRPYDPRVLHTELVRAVHTAHTYANILSGAECELDSFLEERLPMLGLDRDWYEKKLRPACLP